MAAEPLALAVLTQEFSLYSIRRLVEAAKQRGIPCTPLEIFSLTPVTETDRPTLLYKGDPMPAPARAMVRLGVSSGAYGLGVARHLAWMGTLLQNPPDATALARNKFAALQALAAAGLPVPPTVQVRDAALLRGDNPITGTFPVVLKLPEGGQGVGVVRCDSRAALESTLDTFWQLRQRVLVQRYYPEAKGVDHRLFVVDGNVLCAIRREGPPEDFRSNLHRGGKATTHDPTEEETSLAVQAVQTLGMRVAGVDLLPTDDGPVVLEVNPSPGFEGLETATGVDVAGALVDDLMQRI